MEPRDCIPPGHLTSLDCQWDGMDSQVYDTLHSPLCLNPPSVCALSSSSDGPKIYLWKKSPVHATMATVWLAIVAGLPIQMKTGRDGQESRWPRPTMKMGFCWSGLLPPCDGGDTPTTFSAFPTFCPLQTPATFVFSNTYESMSPCIRSPIYRGKCIWEVL